ncbi:MAG: doubled motif LPXTG anchor domain-containing protein, partial [Oscillospiraceae bacterium]|nr:doubled motif LPXTG anchor domain-containing protein [Oscillospiraceae bacterium]
EVVPMEKIRFLGILIAMALVFTLTPVVALADDDISNTDSESVSDSADTGDSTDDTDTDSGESGEGTDETDTEDSTDDATEGDSDTTEADDTTASDEEITDGDDITDDEDANSEVNEDEISGEEASVENAIEGENNEEIETPVAGETTPEKAEEAAVPETTPVNTDTSAVDPAQLPAVTSLEEEKTAQPENKPEELTEEQKLEQAKQETYEKNKSAAESWYVYFYLREEGEQVIANGKFGEYKNGDVAAEAGEKPTEVTTTNSNDVSKWKQEGYTEKAVASGKLGADLVRAIATGDGSHRYESLLPEDYNGSNSFVLDDFKLNDDNKSKLEELGNVEWYVAKVVSGKIHVDGITVKVEEKTEEPEKVTPVITSDSDSDDDDDDDSYYALVAIDDEGVPLAVNPISPAAAIFIADEAVPLASLPVTGGSAANTAAAAGFAMIMLGAALLIKKED